MKIEKCKHQLKCDLKGCENIAEYYFATRGILRREFAFCEDCMKKMSDCFSRICVPKAINAPFKEREKRRNYEKK